MEQQRTQEWFDKRKGRITGSNVGAILGLNPYKTKHDVMREMVREWHGVEREFKGSIATDYGQAMEPQALKDYEQFWAESPVIETGLHVHDEHEWLGASPDGLVGESGVLEIKCPFGMKSKSKEELEFKSIFDQPHYYAQVQIEMVCAKRTYCEFYQWAPSGDNLTNVPLHFNWLSENIPKLKEFYDSYLIEREMPMAGKYLSPRHKQNEDKFLIDKVKKYKDLAEQIKELEFVKKDLLAEIVAESCESELDFGDVGKLSCVVKKGNIDYKSIPALKKINLEKYRKPSSIYWTVK